jgi:uncharacterized membrane protein
MQKVSRWGITLLASLVGSWIGAAMDHNNWAGAASIIGGLIGLAVGYWASAYLDNYINS